MKNKYRIDGDIVYIETNRSDLVIDLEDLDLVSSIKGTWSMCALGYGENTVMVRGVRKRTRLHRYLMNPPEHLCVDHINGNPKDNRRSNMRIVTHQENMNNTKMNRAERGGYKSVYYEPDKKARPWTVRIWDKQEKKTKFVGRFASEQEAIQNVPKQS